MMRQLYTPEIAFLVLVIAVSLVGFSSLARGDEVALNRYHALHIITSLAWILLLSGRLGPRRSLGLPSPRRQAR